VRGLVAVCLSLLLCAAGCGYTLVRQSQSLAGIQTVAIETPRNDSYEPGVELVIADALRREFLRRGAVRVIDASTGADLVLDGEVHRIRTSGRSFDSVVLAVEYELTLSLALRATRPDGSRVPIDARALRETEIYSASADVEATRKNRQEALRHLAVVLAGRVHDSLAESLAQ